MENEISELGITLLLETEIGGELKGELDELMDEFEGFNESYYMEEWQDLLSRMLEFEDSLEHAEIRQFFYGYVARAALNSLDIATAIAYANGAVIINTELGDTEGVKAATMVLCDAAVHLEDYTSALFFYYQAKPECINSPDETARQLTTLKNQPKSILIDLFSKRIVPRTLHFPSSYQMLHDQMEADKLKGKSGMSYEAALNYIEEKRIAKREEVIESIFRPRM